MKSYKDVLATQDAYRRDGRLNSVHRSSLIVPELEGCEASISFVNHFLLKRGYDDVGCRITSIDAQGKRIASRLHLIDEPRVYRFNLTDDSGGAATNHLVEFYSGRNLYVPFPAVVINHHSERFHNFVHAYNRVLNDKFEDDEVNASSVREASIDVQVDGEHDTFFVFSAGPSRCQGTVDITLGSGGEWHRNSVQLDLPGLTNQVISLREYLPGELTSIVDATLTVQQPEQFMFYGRALAGIRHQDGSFSANHSYYDNSTAAEYWEDATPSYRVFPYFVGLRHAFTVYPITSPGELELSLELLDEAGGALATARAGQLLTPSSHGVAIDVEELGESAGVDLQKVNAVRLVATPIAGPTPTRICVQQICEAGSLKSSVAVALYNGHRQKSLPKKVTKWGQVPVGRHLESWLGIVNNGQMGGESISARLRFFGPSGMVSDNSVELAEGQSVAVSFSDEHPLTLELAELCAGGLEYIWYYLEAERVGLDAHSVVRHRDSNHCSGEHAF